MNILFSSSENGTQNPIITPETKIVEKYFKTEDLMTWAVYQKQNTYAKFI